MKGFRDGETKESASGGANSCPNIPRRWSVKASTSSSQGPKETTSSSQGPKEKGRPQIRPPSSPGDRQETRLGSATSRRPKSQDTVDQGTGRSYTHRSATTGQAPSSTRTEGALARNPHTTVGRQGRLDTIGTPVWTSRVRWRAPGPEKRSRASHASDSKDSGARHKTCRRQATTRGQGAWSRAEGPTSTTHRSPGACTKAPGARSSSASRVRRRPHATVAAVLF